MFLLSSAQRFSPEEPPGDPGSSHVPSWFCSEVQPGGSTQKNHTETLVLPMFLLGSTRRFSPEESPGDLGSSHVPSWFFSEVQPGGSARKNHPKTLVLPMFLLASSRRFSPADQARKTTRRPWFFPCSFLVLLGGSARRISPKEPPEDPSSSHVPSQFCSE
ncbi:hypothetical protein Dimus_007805, partial [Dionaea muscipula]